MRRSRLRRLAWVIGVAGVLACCAGAVFSVGFRAPLSFLIVYVVGILMGILGALIAWREPGNSIGWLMCGMSLATSLLHLPTAYAFVALGIEHGAWPLGSFAAWLGSWSWVAILTFLPLIAVRFPDGRAPRHMRAVDWITVGGAGLFSLGIALLPADTLLGFMSVPSTAIDQMRPAFTDAAAGIFPRTILAQVQGLGLVFLLTGYVASATVVTARFRDARGDLRLQVEWFAYSGAVVAAALVYGAIAWSFFGQPLYIALTPVEFAALTLPVAIGIAILRHRLYDIDLLINRTLVYVGVTAILGALYAAVVTFLNRLFISVSGQKSDAAYVITAFVIAVAFGPLKDWLQRQVDRRVGRRDASQALDDFRSGIDEVVAVIDVQRLTRELLDRAAAAFNARWAALYLAPEASAVYTRGDVKGVVGLEVALRHDGRDLGRLAMGRRRGDEEYEERDRVALQRSADSVAEAIALAEQLGHVRAPVAAQ